MATYGSINNQLLSTAKSAEPAVGLGVTVLHYTDREAGTITRVAPGRIWVRPDKAIRTDPNGRSDAQTYRYEPDPEAPEAEYTLRKNGRWVRRGEPMSGESVVIGIRDAYHDYSF